MNNPIQSDYAEIDILNLLRALWKKIWLIVLTMVLMGAIFFSYAMVFVTPMYQSTAMMYVNNSSISLGATSFSISELTAAKSLMDVYVIILKSRTTLEEVIDRAGLEYSHDRLSDMVEAASVNDTEVFSITATSPDPAEAELIVDTIVDILPDRIADIVDGSSVRVVDYAIRPTVRSSPSYTKYAMIGMVFGAAISCAAVVILELMDTTVKDEDYLRQTFGIPVLAVVPDVYTTPKSSHKYGNFYYRRQNSTGSVREKSTGADKETVKK
jgi:capsular polysaccharide biosynthesis protein